MTSDSGKEACSPYFLIWTTLVSLETFSQLSPFDGSEAIGVAFARAVEMIETAVVRRVRSGSFE